MDIEVVWESSGRPTIELRGAARKHADRMGVSRIHVSLTDSNNLAFAEVIFEQ